MPEKGIIGVILHLLWDILELARRTAIVTRAALGVDRATVLRLATEGAPVLVADVDPVEGIELSA